MSEYIKIINQQQQLVLDDRYSNYTLEAIVNLGDLPPYSIDNEVDGGICNRVDYYNKDGVDNGFPYPFFCCLGTKYLGKVCVLYNSSNIVRPCVVINAFTGCCRTYNEGTRKAHSVTIKGESETTLSWTANYKDMYGLYYGILYPDHFADHIPLEALPECLGTAIQPVAIICDNDENGANLKDYYVLVFGRENKTQPQKGDVALCCYDENGNCTFSSKDYPLRIKEYVYGSGLLERMPINYDGKTGIATLMYYSRTMPFIANKSIGFIDNLFSYYLQNVGGHRCWYWMYQDMLNGHFFCRFRTGDYAYLIIDIENICKAYKI